MRRYPEYKESHADWIGEIPAHWEMINTKYLFRLVTEPAPKNNDYELLSIYTDIGVKPRKELEERGNRATTTDGYWLVKQDDFIVNKLLAWMGAIGLSDYDGVTSPAYDILRKIRPLNERFYEYLFRCGLYFIEFKKWSKGIMEVRLRLYFDQFGQIPLVFPMVDEQDKIVNFLDRKTGQIDELIRIKERRIELLHEQRTVLINQAVTKGLDPNVELKSSGVEWIGEIPKHWRIKRLKYISRIVASYVDKHINPDEIQVNLCNYTDVYYNEKIDPSIDFMRGSCNQDEYERSLIKKGDIIITKDSESADDIGIPTFIQKELTNVVCGYHLSIIRPLNEIDGEFLFRFIQSNRTGRYFEVNATGITRFSLGKSIIENLSTLLPPLSEQKEIANFLDRKTQQIDELISAERRKIELLKEYRQSLISEVVTGKIDVRSEV